MSSQQLDASLSQFCFNKPPPLFPVLIEHLKIWKKQKLKHCLKMFRAPISSFQKEGDSVRSLVVRAQCDTLAPPVSGLFGPFYTFQRTLLHPERTVLYCVSHSGYLLFPGHDQTHNIYIHVCTYVYARVYVCLYTHTYNVYTRTYNVRSRLEGLLFSL